MSIKKRIEDAALLWQNDHFEGALLSVLIAVAATARLRYPDRNMISDSDIKFKHNENQDGLLIRAGGAPEYTLKLSGSWFQRLVRIVVKAPENTEVFNLSPNSQLLTLRSKGDNNG